MPRRSILSNSKWPGAVSPWCTEDVNQVYHPSLRVLSVAAEVFPVISDLLPDRFLVMNEVLPGITYSLPVSPDRLSFISDVLPNSTDSLPVSTDWLSVIIHVLPVIFCSVTCCHYHRIRRPSQPICCRSVPWHDRGVTRYYRVITRVYRSAALHFRCVTHQYRFSARLYRVWLPVITDVLPAISDLFPFSLFPNPLPPSLLICCPSLLASRRVSGTKECSIGSL